MIIKTDTRKLLKPDKKGFSSYTYYLSGVFGGATVTLQYLDELGEFRDYTDGTRTAPTEIPISPGAGVELFVNVTGSTGTTEIVANIKGIK